MARLGNTSPNELPAFGRRLMTLARENNLGTPTLLAEALYNNFKDLVEPAKRKNKNGKIVKDRQHDIDAITRMVQTHLNETDICKIQSKYFLAYSKLFNCSLDYLYGTVPVRSTDPDMNAICKKTGLSEKAVEKLMRDSSIYLEGFLYQQFEYDFLYSDIDPEGNITASSFWSELIESDLFISLPEKWVQMACALQLYNATHDGLSKLDSSELKLPDRESFFEIVDEYYATHDHDPCFGSDPYEIYDKDPERALSIIKEIREEERYNLACDEDKSKMVYWGCAGQFDRFLQNYFHDKAESFKIPVCKDYLDN